MIIFDNELIVERTNAWPVRRGIVYPELDSGIMPVRVDMFRKNYGKPGEVIARGAGAVSNGARKGYGDTVGDIFEGWQLQVIE